MAATEFIRKIENDFGVDDAFRELHATNIVLAQHALTNLPIAEQEKLRNVPVALLPTRDLNALCGVTSTGESFIILELGLAAFLEVFNCIFLRSILLAESNEEAITIERAQLLVDAASSLLSGEPDDNADILERVKTHLSEERFESQYRELFIKSQMCWLIGHEYGHLALGHVGTVRNLGFRGVSRSLTIREREQEQEYEADAYGLRFATSWVDRSALPTSRADAENTDRLSFFLTAFQLAAPDVCGSLLRFIEYLHQILDHFVATTFEQSISEHLGDSVRRFLVQSRATHPPARIRHERLRAEGPCHDNHSVLTVAHNAQLIIQQTMSWIHEKKISVERLSKLVPDKLDEIPDDVLADGVEDLFE